MALQSSSRAFFEGRDGRTLLAEEVGYQAGASGEEPFCVTTDQSADFSDEDLQQTPAERPKTKVIRCLTTSVCRLCLSRLPGQQTKSCTNVTGERFRIAQSTRSVDPTTALT